MTYLHDYTNARKKIREDFAPKLIASIMPTLDMSGAEYAPLDGDESGLIVTLPDGFLPDGYRLRIDFTAVKNAAWKTPDGQNTKGPGF